MIQIIDFTAGYMLVTIGQLVIVGDFVYKVHNAKPIDPMNAIYQLELKGKKADLKKLELANKVG